MLTPTFVAGCLAVTFLFRAAPVFGQETFGRLSEKLKPGQTVIVVDDHGARTSGEVVSVSAGELVVKYARGRIADPTLQTSRSFTPSGVDRVFKPAPIWDGAVKGAVVGLIPALINIAADCYNCHEGSFTAFTMGVGAGIGLGIDAAFGPRILYRGHAAPSRVSIAPMIGRHRSGMLASIRF